MSEDKLFDKIKKLLSSNNQILEEKITQNSKALEERMEQMIVANNGVLLNAMDKKIQSSEQRLEAKLTQKIEDSQEDTINTLSDLIHTGYDMHEDRIKRIENELHLPPLKQ